MTALIDITGQRFGRLVVLARDGGVKNSKHAFWICRCDCGAETVKNGAKLRNGWTSSCGCLKREVGKNNRTHGKRKSRIYSTWYSLRQRCQNKNRPDFERYGGRGIGVCERWESFENFYADMGDPLPGMSIDRINNDGNYEPGNCRWATSSEQAYNRRPKR